MAFKSSVMTSQNWLYLKKNQRISFFYEKTLNYGPQRYGNFRVHSTIGSEVKKNHRGSFLPPPPCGGGLRNYHLNKGTS